MHSAEALRQSEVVPDDDELPLFSGPHIPAIRFERALARLDLRAAAQDAPAEWRGALVEMASVIEATQSRSRAGREKLLGCRRPGWPDAIDRVWQRLVGRHLDGQGIPGVLDGELAAAFLLRGGETERAKQSLLRHLEYHPTDVHAWELFTHFDPIRGAARCAFHGGPVLDCATHLLDLVEEDELAPHGPWLLSYAWFSGDVDLNEIGSALRAEGSLKVPPLPVAGDGAAFAWYLVDAGGLPLAATSVGVVEARRRLQRISPIAFRRYLARVHGKNA